MQIEFTGTFVPQGRFDPMSIWQEYETQEILPHVLPDEALDGLDDAVKERAQRAWVMARDIGLGGLLGEAKNQRFRLSVDVDETHATPHCEVIPFADGTQPGELYNVRLPA